MPLTKNEALQILEQINPSFENILAEYDFGKYPADQYQSYQNIFSSGDPTPEQIESSLKWKWGHWGKDNYPAKQQALVTEIQCCWQAYLEQNEYPEVNTTFNWWYTALGGKSTRYITVAYITHLILHSAPCAIIDQHNYRAMGALKRLVRLGHTYKKKPTNLNDLLMLNQFMETLLSVMAGRSFGELDRFLMMYGRNHAPR